jgi:hypothetical protein
VLCRCQTIYWISDDIHSTDRRISESPVVVVTDVDNQLVVGANVIKAICEPCVFTSLFLPHSMLTHLTIEAPVSASSTSVSLTMLSLSSIDGRVYARTHTRTHAHTHTHRVPCQCTSHPIIVVVYVCKLWCTISIVKTIYTIHRLIGISQIDMSLINGLTMTG